MKVCCDTEGRELTDERRYAPTSVPLRRKPCSRSPETLFHFTTSKQMIEPVRNRLPTPRPRRSTRPTAWSPMTLAASALARTFCATSTRSSIEMGRPDGPCRSPPADVSLERHASGEGPDETTRRRADASRVRIPVPVVPVRSWPKWSRRIPTRIAHGIGHGHARVFMESLWQQGGYPKFGGFRTELPASAQSPTRICGGYQGKGGGTRLLDVAQAWSFFEIHAGANTSVTGRLCSVVRCRRRPRRRVRDPRRLVLPDMSPAWSEPSTELSTRSSSVCRGATGSTGFVLSSKSPAVPADTEARSVVQPHGVEDKVRRKRCQR